MSATEASSPEELLREMESLRARLEEAEETLQAIRSGEVDALIVSKPSGEAEVYTLRSAEHPYRILVEGMNEGAVTLLPDGTILFCNQSFATLLKTPHEHLIGYTIARFVMPEDVALYEALVRQGLTGDDSGKGELTLKAADGTLLPVNLSSSSLQLDDIKVACLIVTDLSEQKRNEEIVAAEKLARLILEQAAEAIVVCDEDGRITRISKQASDLCACHALLQSFDTAFPLRHVDKQMPAASLSSASDCVAADNFTLATVLEGVACLNYDVTFARADGELFHLLLNAVPIYGTENEILGCVITLVDFTERKRSEEALRESEQRLRLTLETSQLGDWELNLSTQITQRSLGHDHIFGYDELLPEWTYDMFLSHVHPDDRAEVNDSFTHSLKTGDNWQFECRIYRADNQLRWISATGRVFLDATGQPVRILGLVGDITERKLAEEERERLLAREHQARRVAEEANRLKDEFLATLSHELRTPLTSIIGWSNMLQGGTLDADTSQRALETIHRNAHAQNQLISDLLDISRIITGKLRLDVRAVELATVIDAAVDAARPAAAAKQIRLQTLLDPSAGAVSGDADRLQQVFWNLLTNAIKFTPKGGRVQIRLERINSHVEVTVSDTGQGINPDFLPHVFDRFRQADGTTTRVHGGLGLGLSIVRQLVELHGGTVRAESDGEGHGASFIVSLPFIVARRQSGELEWRHPTVGGIASLECPPQLTGLHVLVVDDEVDTCELLRAVLEECDSKVTTAQSVDEAMREIERMPPDILVSDIGMPGADGYELIGKVRALTAERGGRIPAVALTAYARTEDRVRALTAGFQVHVPKPIEPIELVAVIASLANRTGNA